MATFPEIRQRGSELETELINSEPPIVRPSNNPPLPVNKRKSRLPANDELPGNQEELF